MSACRITSPLISRSNNDQEDIPNKKIFDPLVRLEDYPAPQYKKPPNISPYYMM